MPEWIPRAPFPASTRDGEKRMIDYPLVNDDLALLWMVNMGCIDMNAWTSRVDLPARPDWVIFDLDPSDDVGFPEVIEVALLVKQILDLVGLESFPKTSGSRGIHVLVPIARRHGYDADAGVRGDRRRGSRARPPRSRHDRVDEEQAPRRARRRQPERAREDDGDGLLGAAAARALPSRRRFAGTRCGAGLDPLGVHASTRCACGSPVTATCSRPCSDRGSRSVPRFARSARRTPKSGRAGSRPVISTGTGETQSLRSRRRSWWGTGMPRGLISRMPGLAVAELLGDAGR